ncbi:MAG: hypothetical protein IJ594_06135, partial [Oscillospiraceae bacterium]|nr:hypothetical protein [Oscillospiraceae bacterium]
MVKRRKIIHILPLLLLWALLLGGCGAGEKEPVPDNSGVTELSLVLEANEFYKLTGYSSLKKLDLSGSTCYDEILDWMARNPQVDVRYTVELPDGTVVDNDVTALDLSGLDGLAVQEASTYFAYLPALQTVDLGSMRSGGPTPDTLRQLQTNFPQIVFPYELRIGETAYTLDAEELDLSETEDVTDLLAWLPYMQQLQTVQLGRGDAEAGRISWEEIAAMEAAAPQATFEYVFVLYDKAFSLQSKKMDLNHIEIADQGALVKKIAACMPKLNYLDMDFCGVDDEHMADIRDSLPNATVVWRIWFGNRYTARTDTERILASNPDRGGNLTSANTQSLKYCTKVKYLDVGHNLDLEDISFIYYMPDLEVAVLAMNQWTDARPLASCPNLEYLEMQTGACSDLRPLSQLKNLKHLNICYCLALRDISPIYDLDLERLWVGSISPISEKQVQEYHRRHPNCEINTTCVDPTTEGWRYMGWDAFGVTIVAPRYQLLREQFEY